jgi:hypothetical protein
MASNLRARSLAPFTLFIASAVLIAPPAFAQQTQAVNDERIAISGSIDVLNVYMFRGVRQDDTGAITWPAAELGLRLRRADNGLTGVQVRVGTWNSLHSGWAGSSGPSGKLWYESNVYGGVAFEFGNAVTLGTTYTAYRSPNDMFTTVKELSVNLALDGPQVAGALLRPYALAAFELDTKPGVGQLDGGFKSGRYLELGAAPGASFHRIGIAVPVRVGLSLGNYYELAGDDHPFGFASVSGIATVPVTRWWNVHGGIEYQRLGTTTKTFNGGDASKTVASIGAGFSR